MVTFVRIAPTILVSVSFANNNHVVIQGTVSFHDSVSHSHH